MGQVATKWGITVGDDDCAGKPLDADGLLTALDCVVLEGTHDWLLDAVVTACANGDLLFLQRQVERHVPGWVRP